MTIKSALKLALIFGSGVIVGVLAFLFLLLLSGWDALSFTKTTPMAAIPLTVQTAEGVTVELGTDSYHGVTLSRRGQQVIVSPPPKIIWTKMAVADKANTVYLLAHEEVGHYYYNPVSLVRISLPNSNESLSNYVVGEVLARHTLSNLIGAAFVAELDSVSTDGKRLLLRVACKDQTNSAGYTSYFTRKTFHYYPEMNKLDEITP